MNKILFALSMMLLLSMKCRKGSFSYIWIQNNSDQVVVALASRHYPDTSIPGNNNELRGVPAGKKIYYEIVEENWSELFSSLPADTLSIFLFSGDTLSKYGWQEVRSGYKILTRYDLGKQHLEDINFTITYP